jgi:hypothetical protein
MAIVTTYTSQARPILASDLIYRAGILLQDETHIRWTTTELIAWINEGVGALIRLKPAAGAKRVLFGLASGAMQTLDEYVVQLIDVVHNMAADKVTPGRAIRLTDRQLIDSANPDWHTMKKATVIKHFMYDDRTPAIFYVYPPSMPNVLIEAVMAIMPAPIDNELDKIQLSLEYADSVLNYMLYRAFAKDNEYANAAMSTGYYQAFIASMGTGDQGEQVTTPTNKVPA